MQISRAHRVTGRDITQTNSKVHGPKFIFAQFLNWRVVQEVRNKVILNAQQKKNVCQMFLKELREQRNSALKYHREYITDNQHVQIKLEYLPSSKVSKKGSYDDWETTKEFKIYSSFFNNFCLSVLT